jgi:hypothetical protein
MVEVFILMGAGDYLTLLLLVQILRLEQEILHVEMLDIFNSYHDMDTWWDCVAKSTNTQ